MHYAKLKETSVIYLRHPSTTQTRTSLARSAYYLVFSTALTELHIGNTGTAPKDITPARIMNIFWPAIWRIRCHAYDIGRLSSSNVEGSADLFRVLQHTAMGPMAAFLGFGDEFLEWSVAFASKTRGKADLSEQRAFLDLAINGSKRLLGDAVIKNLVSAGKKYIIAKESKERTIPLKKMTISPPAVEEIGNGSDGEMRIQTPPRMVFGEGPMKPSKGKSSKRQQPASPMTEKVSKASRSLGGSPSHPSPKLQMMQQFQADGGVGEMMARTQLGRELVQGGYHSGAWGARENPKERIRPCFERSEKSREGPPWPGMNRCQAR
eukprot:GHVO01069009.1.p1 GENE.GHVO01069009.1~~GHVO01069009.1.p1  ORF type:complete len:322 (-),score=17.60 GHVO01069009.1:334-1299(-)